MNEITISIFESLGVFLLILVIYTLIRKALLTSILSVIISYVMAQSILNGNVVAVTVINNAVAYQPIQSSPIHYLLLGVAVIMTVMTFYILLMIVNARIEGMEENNEKAQWSD